jgi:hypothetical protein
LKRFANVDTAVLSVAVDASLATLKKQAHAAHLELQKTMSASVKLHESVSSGSSKFSIFTMATGSIDDFHKGLQDRIGELDGINGGVFARWHCDRYCILLSFPRMYFTPIRLRIAQSGLLQGHARRTHDKRRQRLRFRDGQLQCQDTGAKGMAVRLPLYHTPCICIHFIRFRYIVGDENGQVVHPPPSDMIHDVGDGLVVRRIIQPIDELLQKPLAVSAKLTREEIIAIVMYTGPVFVLYNAVLRRFPPNIYSVFKDSGNLFPTTIFVLVSAINKLSRCMNVAPGTLLYRGLGGTMEFPDRFTRADPTCTTPNALGYLEFGFMSTTADRSVAVQYSGVKEGKPKAGILQLQPNSVDRGADISEFSQYPGEKEYLILPYSFVQGEGRQRTEVDGNGGVLTIVPVRVNINLKTETVEELKERKKRMHLVSARAMVEEVRYELQQWASSKEALDRLQRDDSRNKKGGPFSTETLAAAIVKQCLLALNRHEDTCVEEFVDDGVFRSLVSEMLDIKAWALEKKNLWMNDTSQYIWYLQGWSLRECHRLWLSFLNSRIANAKAELSDRARDSVKLLVSRGLIMRGVRGEVNEDGEDVLVRDYLASL